MPFFVLAVLFISSCNVLSGYFYEFNSSTHCLNFGKILNTGGGGLPYMGYIGMCRCEGYGFHAAYTGIRYINQRVWVQNRISFSRKLINWLKKELPLKNIKTKSVLVWLDYASDLSSFWKTATLGKGGFGEFSLV